MTQWRSEFRPMPIAPQPVLHGPLADLLEWQSMAQGAYSANTLRAQKSDGAIFQAYCESVGEPFLPANPHTVREFIGAQVKAGKKPATIQRYVATISRVHTAAHLHNPCSSEAVRLGLKKMGRETSARQDQAHPLNWKDIKEFIDSAGDGLRADRERAMLCVAYETLARRGELVALEVRDIDFHPNGTGQALIRRGKTDAEGQGRVNVRGANGPTRLVRTLPTANASAAHATSSAAVTCVEPRAPAAATTTPANASTTP